MLELIALSPGTGKWTPHFRLPNLPACKPTWWAAQCGTACWTCPYRTATEWWWGPRPDRGWRRAFCQWAKTSPSTFTPSPKKTMHWPTPSAKPRPAKRGFVIHAAPGVALAQDLARRDFTINSIAHYSILTWEKGILGTVFSEDRHFSPICGTLCRFFCGARDGAAEAREGGPWRGRSSGGRARVAATGTRADAGKPPRMLEVLRECGALPRLLPEIEL